jgi:hypothetical protein
VSPRLRAIVVALALAVSGCGSSGSERSAVVRVDEIPSAVKAVETRLGGMQRYSEINATPSEVNLFVVDADGRESAYVYRKGRLEPPADTQRAQGATFAAADIEFDPDKVLGEVAKELPDAAVLTFSVQPSGGVGTQLVATVQSDKGGQISVLLAPDGRILGAQPES